MKDFYYILNVDANSTFMEIKEAYENLSAKFQPFLHQKDKFIENQFSEICDAYQVLSDPVSREKYDQELHNIKFIPIKTASKVRRSFFKTRTIDITFTVILGLFTCIFGFYVMISIRNVKAAKAKKVMLAVAVPQHKTIHHKIKRHPKTYTKRVVPNIAGIDTAEAFSPQQKPVAAPPIYTDKNSIASPTIADNTLNETKPVNDIPASNPPTTNDANLPYTTYLKANETGIINMRKFDNYRSQVIMAIPTNSEVAVLERGNSFYKVIFDNTTGFVAKWNVLKK